ncbi:CRACD-like protein isoform X1 [Mobula hypostoma]|uniref:CRACD-like protein isoform X1 n=2 Tax=Mobula hypostoma TaxID=723540 RepID=UPI002FC2FC46
MAGLYCCLRGGSRDHIMATALPDTRQTSEMEELNDEYSGKKKSKFKTFKNFFTKKKRKVTAAPKRENNLKPSQSSTDVSTAEPSEAQPDSETGSQSNIGSRAFSHDSIFIPELSISESVSVRGASQENVAGRVKALQLQLEQNIRLSSPGMMIPSVKNEDAGTMSEDDGLPRSPPEMSSLHAVLRCSTPKCAVLAERHNSLSLGGTESEDEELISLMPSSRPLSPLVLMTTSCDSLPVDFSSPASSHVCLNNTAAKHKIAVNPRRQKIRSKQMKSIIREKSGGSEDKGKGERNQVGATVNQLPNECQQENDALVDGDIDVHFNKMPCPKILEVNNEECAEKVPNISKTLATSDSHSAEPEDASDGEVTNLNTDTSPSTINQEVLPSEPVFPSESMPDTEKNPIAGQLGQETVLVHEEDSKLSSTKAVIDIKANDALPSGTTPVTVADSLDCLENRIQEADKSTTGEGFLLGEVERDLVSTGAVTTPSLKCNLAAQLQEEGQGGPILNKLSAPEHSFTSKQAKGVTPSNEKLGSCKECQEGVESSLTDQSVMEGTDVESLLNQRPEHVPKPCNELTDSVGILSEDLVKQSERSTSQFTHSQAQPELSVPDELSQEHLRPSNQGSIKFSIASAWQRSIMDTRRKNVDWNLQAVPKSGCCEDRSEGSAKQDSTAQQILNLPLKVKADENEQASMDNNLLDIERQAETEQDTKGSPFGVRLRRTSPLYKYSTEGSIEHTVERKDPAGETLQLATQTPALRKGDSATGGQAGASLSTGTEKDIGKKAAKSLPEDQRAQCPMPEIHDSLETSTETAMEEKHLVSRGNNERKNSETYVEFGKTSERNSIPAKPEPADSPRVNASEPAWVSLARQKQKGFQDQYAGTQEKAQLLGEQSLIQTDTKTEATKHLIKKVADKEPPSGIQSKEMKTSVKEEYLSRITTQAGSHLPPKAQACGMGMREKRPMPNTKLAPLATVEPPWLAIAKKKAKAWSDMPQTVQ